MGKCGLEKKSQSINFFVNDGEMICPFLRDVLWFLAQIIYSLLIF